MELKSFFTYLAIMAGSTYLIRAIPFALINKKIENRFIKSFLHYIPFAVLSAMTFPAILYATDYVISAAIGFGVAILFASKGKSLTTVAVAACVAVFVVESLIGVVG
ncbi:MAG: AzlD domain-containing protein [Roseburia sp.]|nr:AzlD domain-containing protein [Roseburia sp.]